MTPYGFGVPALLDHVALLRYLLVGVGLLWAAAVARQPRTQALGVGLLFTVAATGFWVLCLGRPYGLLEHAATTRRAAEVSVAAATGRVDESFVAGEPIAYRGFMALLQAGLPAGSLIALPSLLPPAVLAAIGLLVFALWSRRDEALGAACLWLAFATGELDAVRGFGLLPSIWQRPEAALLLVPAVGLGLVAARLPRPWGMPLAAGIALACSGLAAPGPAPAAGEAVLLLTLDQLPWLALGAFGLVRSADPASRGLCAGGALAVLSSAFSSALDCFSGQAFYRLGLMLASAAACRELLREPGLAALRHSPRLAGLAPERLGIALLLALGAPGAFATWWDPVRTDGVARASLEPISPALLPVMSFIRESTPRAAVFVASPDYAPAVAVLGGRRVLRAPSVFVTADDQRRLRAEAAILGGRALPPGADGHGARFILLAPGDFKARGVAGPDHLEGRSGFQSRYADSAQYRVYEVVPVESAR